jgi:hypothetical protein
MKGIRVTPCASLLIALLFAGPLLARSQPGSARLPQQKPPHGRTQASNQPEEKAFSGKIIKNRGGKYVLDDSSVDGPYFLDDQPTARKYEGKAVVITGTLDTSINTIYVKKIEAVA